MLIIREVKSGMRSTFERIHADENGRTIFNESIKYRLFKIKENEQGRFILYDDNMNVISSAYQYVNIYMSNQPYNTREKTIYAIRLFYCFLHLTKARLTELSLDDIEKLKYFLLGYSPKKGSYSMQLQTVRSNSTVNEYLSIYRSYLNYLGIECKYLYDTKNSTMNGVHPEADIIKSFTSYSSNLKTSTPVQRAPRYISVDNFIKVIKIIREDSNIMAECIVRLMYQFGLRLGEVLGLTFEDLVEENINGTLYPVLFIRNRLTDKHFQKAKTCMNIIDRSQYRSKDYKIENYGYQKLIITYDIFELINTYIEVAHSTARNKNIKRYKNGATADKVIKNKYETENYYIFINSIGTILSEQSWNKYIKSVFYRAEIPIDSKSKKTNLNHRFRHGFAMFHVQHRKTPLLELQKLMRHASISSTMIYYNPTEIDEAIIKNEFVNEIYELIPGLRR